MPDGSAVLPCSTCFEIRHAPVENTWATVVEKEYVGQEMMVVQRHVEVFHGGLDMRTTPTVAMCPLNRDV